MDTEQHYNICTVQCCKECTVLQRWPWRWSISLARKGKETEFSQRLFPAHTHSQMDCARMMVGTVRPWALAMQGGGTNTK